MELNYTVADEAFRAEVRTWLAANLPKEMQLKVQNHRHLTKDDFMRWHKTMAAKGWVAPSWPVEWGGTGWTPTQKHIFDDECAAAGTPQILPFGIAMVGPVIMRFANEGQKRHYLPRILDGTDWWCQGYSEPGSGSDLASLKTRAEKGRNSKGESIYIVNGQKTWTTMAQHADMIFCLVRTDPEVKKQEGISFLLIDMRTPGITVRPILTLDESAEVNEVFFDNVEVPVENLVGDENKGWTYAKYLLGHERTGIARVGASKRELNFLKQVAQEQQVDGKPLSEEIRFASKVAELEIDLMALEMTVLRVVSSESHGKGPGPEASLLKVKGTEVQQRLTELMLEAIGPRGLPFHVEEFDDASKGESIDPLAAIYFNYRKTSIYGGSNEIQKNIMTQMILGL